MGVFFGGKEGRTPRRVAFAAALAFALGLVPALPDLPALAPVEALAPEAFTGQFLLYREAFAVWIGYNSSSFFRDNQISREL